VLVFKLEGQPETNTLHKAYIDEDVAFLNDKDALGVGGMKLMEVSTGTQIRI
jgi:hypothetical protein